MAKKRTTTQANKRAKAASDARQADVVRMYLTGSTIADIVRETGFAYRTIMRDMERARQTWKEETGKVYDELLPEKLAQLDAIRAQAWIGWKKSLRADVRKTKSVTNNSDGGSDTNTVSRSKANGDPRFLAQLEKCLRLECQLRGLLDSDLDTQKGSSAQVVEIVIASKEEHEEFKILSMESLRKQTGAAK